MDGLEDRESCITHTQHTHSHILFSLSLILLLLGKLPIVSTQKDQSSRLSDWGGKDYQHVAADEGKGDGGSGGGGEEGGGLVQNKKNKDEASQSKHSEGPIINVVRLGRQGFSSQCCCAFTYFR